MPVIPVLITDLELTDLCDYLSITTYIYYPVATDYFSDLNYTGCRPSELLDVTKWFVISLTQVTLMPAKGNLLRTFEIAGLSASLILAINTGTRPYSSLSYRQLKSVLYKIIPVAKIITNEKSAIDYIFRYNAVKKFSRAGKTDFEISEIFGWNNTLMATSYRVTNIYSYPALPPFLPNNIIDQSGEYLIDETGVIITF